MPAVRKLGKPTDQRLAMLRAMTTYLLENGQLKTTVSRAKEVAPLADCHGSVWRMIPTAILGAVMAYILLETENMIYNMLFHFINNAVPVLLIGLSNILLKLFSGKNIWEMADQMGQAELGGDMRVPLASVGVYMMYAGGAPLLLYIGRYLLRKGQPGHDRGLFPPEKKRQMMLMVGIGMGISLLGFALLLVYVGMETAAAMRYPF